MKGWNLYFIFFHSIVSLWKRPFNLLFVFQISPTFRYAMLNINVLFFCIICRIMIRRIDCYMVNTFISISNNNLIILCNSYFIGCSVFISWCLSYSGTIICFNRFNLKSFFFICIVFWCMIVFSRCYRHYPVFPGIDTNLFVRFNRNIFTSFFRAYGTRITVFWKYFLNRNKIILLISHCYLLSVFHLDCNNTIGTVIKHSVIFSDVHTVFSIYFRTKEIKMSSFYW